MKTLLRLLVVEDSELDTDLLVRELQRSGSEVVYTRVDTEGDFAHALQQEDWDIVISDYTMPGFNAPEALEILKHISPDTPMIVLSGDVDAEMALFLMRSGARDCLPKSDLIKVPAIVKRELENAKIRCECRQEQDAVNRIVTVAAEARNLRTTLEKLMNEALDIVDLEGATICLVTPEETLELAVQKETSEATIVDLTTNKIKIGDCLCGNCARDLKPLILEDRQAVLKFATREATRGEDIRFHAAFPLVTEGRCVGVLCVFTRTDKKPTHRSLKLLETVTLQIAFVVERARLFELVQRNAEELEKRVRERTAQLEAANRELEAFSYSVSHDLRTPLRHINAYAHMLEESCGKLVGSKSLEYIEKIQQSSKRMADLTESLLRLSRITQADVVRETVDLSATVRSIADNLRENAPGRRGIFRISEGLKAEADPGLMQIVMENLLGNAWKFTSNRDEAVIEFDSRTEDDKTVYMVRDNGVGFDSARAGRLFTPFQRLHPEEEFAGMGIGLATVDRIIRLHGGRIWAESKPGEGAAFYFTLE